MKSGLIISALVGAVAALDQTTYKFLKYLSQWNKSYNSLDEFNMRLKNFAKTDEFIENWMADKSNTSSVAHNMFSDMSEDERFPRESRTYPEDREDN